MWLSVYVNQPRIHICGDDQILAVLHEHGTAVCIDLANLVTVLFTQLHDQVARLCVPMYTQSKLQVRSALTPVMICLAKPTLCT